MANDPSFFLDLLAQKLERQSAVAEHQAQIAQLATGQQQAALEAAFDTGRGKREADKKLAQSELQQLKTLFEAAQKKREEQAKAQQQEGPQLSTPEMPSDISVGNLSPTQLQSDIAGRLKQITEGGRAVQQQRQQQVGGGETTQTITDTYVPQLFKPGGRLAQREVVTQPGITPFQQQQLRLREQEIQQQAIGGTIKQESEALAATLGRVRSKDATSADFSEQFNELRQRLDPQTAGRVLFGAIAQDRANQRAEELKRAESMFTSEEIERRGSAAEARQGGKATERARQLEADLLLKISKEGSNSLSTNERAFLDERAKLDPMTALRRSLLGDLNLAAPQRGTPEQGDIDRAYANLTAQKGAPPTNEELRAYMESQGWKF